MNNFRIVDKNGAVIACIGDRLFLDTKKGRSTQGIGHFNKAGDYIKGKEKPLKESKHKFKANDAWAVNKTVIDTMDPQRAIIIYTDRKMIGIFIKDFISSPDVQVIGFKGYDLQYLIPEKLFKVREYQLKDLVCEGRR